MTLIVDISSKNRMPDFRSMRRSGIRGVFIKATEGQSFVSPTFYEAWHQADRAGLIVGSYHFSRQDLHPSLSSLSSLSSPLPLGDGYMGVAQTVAAFGTMVAGEEEELDERKMQALTAGARAEAQHYISVMHHLPGHNVSAWKAGNFRPTNDFEVGTASHHYSPWRDAFADEIYKHTKHFTQLYTYPGFNTWLVPKKRYNKGLWIAHYGVHTPTIPRQYSRAQLWQFTSSGSVGGMHERADVSQVLTDLRSLRCSVNG